MKAFLLVATKYKDLTLCKKDHVHCHLGLPWGNTHRLLSSWLYYFLHVLPKPSSEAKEMKCNRCGMLFRSVPLLHDYCQLMELMSLPLASSARIKSCPHSPFSPGLALSDFFVFLEKSASWTYFFLTIGTWLLNWICSGHRQWSSPFRASRKWSRYGRNVSPCLVNT